MRRFTYQDDDGIHIVTEQEIKDNYYIYWQEQMRKVGKEDLIDFELCLDQWIVMNWAIEIEPDENPTDKT